VGILGEGGIGKTSLGEALLFTAGATTRLGKVSDGTSVLSFEPEEIKRQITISTSFHDLSWKRHNVFLVDPPGYANFLPDTRCCMEAMGGAIFVASSTGQLKVESERMWGWAHDLGLPRLVFLNRMDREEGSLGNALTEMQKVLDAKLVAVHVPIGSQDNFRGVIDLLSMKALVAVDDSGVLQEQEIPSELQGEADEYREKLVEAVAELNDDILTRYLEGEEISREELGQTLRKGVFAGTLFPVLCGSALKNLGSGLLLDAIVDYLPAPADRKPAVGEEPKTGEQVERKPDSAEPFSAKVFKTIIDPFTGKLSIFQVLSGTVESDSTAYNSTRETKERLGQIFRLQGKKQEPVPSATVGEVVAVAKLKDTHSGDTLCDERASVRYKDLVEFSPAISFALGLKSRGDEEKITTALQRLTEEDVALRVGRDAQSKEILISGAGQLHIEVIVEKLKRKFGVEVELKAPKVPYRETIVGKANAQGKYKKQSGGRGQYGDTWIEIEPLSRGAGFEFVNKIVGGAIPRQYIPSVEKGIRNTMGEGVLAGYPMVDVRVTLYDGSFHEVDSSDMAFQIAGSMGFKIAVEKAKPSLLEPIMAIEVIVPEEYVGDITGDLNRRRGKLLGVDAKASNQIIRAHVPMAEVLSYAPDLRSMTSGRGDFQVEFSHYDRVAPELAEKIIAQTKQAQAEQSR
jgi:elongation factor G